MTSHARLSPSSSERWLQCPGSVRLSEAVVQTLGPPLDSVYAREGTLAHKRAEIEAAYILGLVSGPEFDVLETRWRGETPPEWQEDMAAHAVTYATHLRELVNEEPHTQVLLEQRVNTGVPHVWGTADATLLGQKHLRVVDYKYGMGIRVSAYRNPQLRLYALGMLDAFEALAEIETVHLTVIQPRLDYVSHDEISADRLRRWRDEVVKPQALLALGPDAYLSPSEKACKFCPAAGDCRARTEWAAKRDFGDPALLTVEEVGQLLHDIPAIRDWCNAVEKNALHQAYENGVPIPGWKVVRSGGRRSIKDDEAAIEALTAAGFPASLVSRRTVETLGNLEKHLGRDKLNHLIGDLIIKSAGKESLVPVEDRRPAIDRNSEAATDFSHEG